MVRKFVMTMIWRITQTGPILSLFFWSAALAGIFWPIIGRENPPGPLFQWLLGFGVPVERVTVIGLSLLFFLFAAFILFIVFVYDRGLNLWREQMEIVYERNPYVDDLLFRKEILQFEQYYLPLARAVYKVSQDPGLEDSIRRVEEWIATGKIKAK